MTGGGTVPFLDGWEAGSDRGTSWHGIFESDVAAVRERRYDVLADMIDEHLDTAALLKLIEDGPPADLPTLVSSLSVSGDVM